MYDTFTNSNAYSWSGVTGLTPTSGDRTRWTSDATFTAPVTITLKAQDDGYPVKDPGGPFAVGSLTIYPSLLDRVDLDPSTRTQWFPPGVTLTATAHFVGYPSSVTYHFYQQTNSATDKELEVATETSGGPHKFTVPSPGTYYVIAIAGSQSKTSATVSFYDNLQISVNPTSLNFDFNPGVVNGEPVTFIENYGKAIILFVEVVDEATELAKEVKEMEHEVETLKEKAEHELSQNHGKPLSGQQQYTSFVEYLTALIHLRNGIDAMNHLMEKEGEELKSLQELQLQILDRPKSITKSFKIHVSETGSHSFSISVDNSQTTWTTSSQGNLSFSPASGSMSTDQEITVTALGNLGTGKIRVIVDGRTAYLDFASVGLTQQQALDTFNIGAQRIENLYNEYTLEIGEVALSFGAIAKIMGALLLILGALVGGFFLWPILALIIEAYATTFAVIAVFGGAAAVLAWTVNRFSLWLNRDAKTKQIQDQYSK